MTTLEAIRAYWNTRAEGFSLKTAHELQHEQARWADRVRPFFPREGRLSVLDVGCGPGFLAILLAKLGHEVTAFDYTEQMLERARVNAAEAGVHLTVCRGDAQSLPFGDGAFDMVVSRNLTWNLEQPERAYAEWLRVLAPGGSLLNFDGNHYRHLYDEAYAELEAQDGRADAHSPEYMLGVDPTPIREVARQLPLSRVDRPQWDVAVLLGLHADRVAVEVEHRRFRSSQGKECSLIGDFAVAARKMPRVENTPAV
ncbi:MAG TPA: class I SAM-dependent methyltransferase [Candidatus Avidesulfovibrio excrementigallinarum]|nr:class I SAM-dependent methyltransferase [Candidatus Avidesulfovibrio excrementigallinarum]